MTIFHRFSKHYIVDKKSGCWNWTAFKNRGYGKLTISENGNIRVWLAHRISYFLYVGHLPHHLMVCHHCDNPSCVNPHHLFLGTRVDNCNDMVKKGRVAKGQDSGKAKLTNQDVFTIRYLITNGLSNKAIAYFFNVRPNTISGIKTKTTWAHLPIH